MLLARMEPWHWWIGVIFTLATVGALVGLGAQYVQKVIRPQYPTRRQRQQPNG